MRGRGISLYVGSGLCRCRRCITCYFKCSKNTTGRILIKINVRYYRYRIAPDSGKLTSFHIFETIFKKVFEAKTEYNKLISDSLKEMFGMTVSISSKFQCDFSEVVKNVMLPSLLAYLFSEKDVKFRISKNITHTCLISLSISTF